MHRTNLLPLALLLGLVANTAMAGTLADMVTYRGFGTAGIATTDTNDAEFVQTGQSSGARKNVDYKTDSKLALQTTIAPTSWLSGTAQMLTEQRFGPDFTTQIEWAYVKAMPLPGLSLRGGKMALPTFLVSDSRNVGYANTWVRAPDEVYGQEAFDTFQGADITYQHPLGPYQVTLSALAGTTVTDVRLGANTIGIVKGDNWNLRGYSLNLDLDTITIRASRVTTLADVFVGGHFAAKSNYSFDSIGAIYDRNNIVVQSEFIERRTGLDRFNNHGWYLLGGYHLDNWLPYALYAGGMRPASIVFAKPQSDRDSVSIGVRLDLFKSVDFKAQIDHVKTTYPDGTPFIHVQREFGGKANVFSLAVDFVF